MFSNPPCRSHFLRRSVLSCSICEMCFNLSVLFVTYRPVFSPFSNETVVNSSFSPLEFYTSFLNKKIIRLIMCFPLNIKKYLRPSISQNDRVADLKEKYFTLAKFTDFTIRFEKTIFSKRVLLRILKKCFYVVQNAIFETHKNIRMYGELTCTEYCFKCPQNMENSFGRKNKESRSYLQCKVRLLMRQLLRHKCNADQ